MIWIMINHWWQLMFLLFAKKRVWVMPGPSLCNLPTFLDAWRNSMLRTWVSGDPKNQHRYKMKWDTVKWYVHMFYINVYPMFHDLKLNIKHVFIIADMITRSPDLTQGQDLLRVGKCTKRARRIGSETGLLLGFQFAEIPKFRVELAFCCCPIE